MLILCHEERRKKKKRKSWRQDNFRRSSSLLSRVFGSLLLEYRFVPVLCLYSYISVLCFLWHVFPFFICSYLFLNFLPFSFSNHYLAPGVDRLIRFPGVCSLGEYVALGYSVLQLMVFTFYVDVDFNSPEALSTWRRRLKGLSNWRWHVGLIRPGIKRIFHGFHREAIFYEARSFPRPSFFLWFNYVQQLRHSPM